MGMGFVGGGGYWVRGSHLGLPIEFFIVGNRNGRKKESQQ